MEIEEVISLGHIGDRLSDGPLGQALTMLANAVVDYVKSDNYTAEADHVASMAMDASHLMIDALQDLGILET